MQLVTPLLNYIEGLPMKHYIGWLEIAGAIAALIEAIRDKK